MKVENNYTLTGKLRDVCNNIKNIVNDNARVGFDEIHFTLTDEEISEIIKIHESLLSFCKKLEKKQS